MASSYMDCDSIPCSLADLVMMWNAPMILALPSAPCLTVSAGSAHQGKVSAAAASAVASNAGASCVFPFRYGGVVYGACTRIGSTVPWCATEVDSAGAYVEGKWGLCSASCEVARPPASGEPMSLSAQASTELPDLLLNGLPQPRNFVIHCDRPQDRPRLARFTRQMHAAGLTFEVFPCFVPSQQNVDAAILDNLVSWKIKDENLLLLNRSTVATGRKGAASGTAALLLLP
eukprot:TRINITY_DN5683_c0_g3_i3.p1 TRINITY_DN5683_c0_g3~~TRINITY_DN5683_c0_g3_i3.p1  ORF type:complete len:252 (+),score=34.81 TRINITY_DN5683_c0_g3_i3:65-757(+)